MAYRGDSNNTYTSHLPPTNAQPSASHSSYGGRQGKKEGYGMGGQVTSLPPATTTTEGHSHPQNHRVNNIHVGNSTTLPHHTTLFSHKPSSASGSGRTGLDLSTLLKGVDPSANDASRSFSARSQKGKSASQRTRLPPQPNTSRGPHYTRQPSSGNMGSSNTLPVAPQSSSANSKVHVAPQPPETPRTGYQGTGRLPIPTSYENRDEVTSSSATPKDGSFGKISPSRALQLYESSMTKYERKEILDYDEIYFIGVDAKKILAPLADAPNFGYDDEKGDYNTTLGDHVAFRYEIVSELGKGSFGQVMKAKDHKKNSYCALKIIRNKKRFHQQATVEIRILDHLRCRDPEERSCTVRMLNYFKFRSHTIITFEMHSMNIYELTKLNSYQPFAPALIKRFTAQLLVALSFMWQEHIVHCDLKPENILLKQENKTSIKIIDFGSSCFESERIYSYIQSRFYRAPEIIFGLAYGRKIDMWSLGCVICEMQIGYPIFPGENEKEQIQCIMEVLGVPPSRFVEKAPRREEFFEASTGAPKITPNSRNKVRKPGTKDLQRALRSDDGSFVDFIRCFLQWDPAERMTPHEAMRHPWIMECFKQDTVTASEKKSIAAEQAYQNRSKQLPNIDGATKRK